MAFYGDLGPWYRGSLRCNRRPALHGATQSRLLRIRRCATARAAADRSRSSRRSSAAARTTCASTPIRRRTAKIIEGLTTDDFEIFEDGKPQTIAAADFVTFDELPDDDVRPMSVAREGPGAGRGLALPRLRVRGRPRRRSIASSGGTMRDAITEFLERRSSPRDLRRR